MSNKQPTTSTQRVESPNNGDKLPLEAPTDQWGNTHQDLDRYPEGSAARAGETTAPSGQGGSTPHDGVSYQDQWPPNPQDEYSLAWGEYLAAKDRGEDPEMPTPKTPEEKKGATTKATTKTTTTEKNNP